MLPRVLRGHGSIPAFQIARHAFRPDTAASSEFSSKIASSFLRDPESTGKQILRFLGPEERSELINILNSQNGTSVSNFATQAASRWIDIMALCWRDTAWPCLQWQWQLPAKSDTKHDTRCRVKAPSSRVLGYLAVAAGVPFIAFGFMDNAIMVMIPSARMHCTHCRIPLAHQPQPRCWKGYNHDVCRLLRERRLRAHLEPGLASLP